MEKTYSASLSQSQGREGWSVIFRHPVRNDRNGKPGLRVRRGLGTKEENEAERLVSELNQILHDQTLWELSARTTAEYRFDARVVEIFYADIVPEITDFSQHRNSVIPLPSMDGDYRRVLLVGTTGSGKTTLARQVLGTDPATERFPSTSTGKTTVADMEVILDQGPYRVVVTFLPRDQVRDYVEECMSAAAMAAFSGSPDQELLRRLLNHVSQRFRLNYILGQGPFEANGDDKDYEDEEIPFDDAQSSFDLTQSNALLQDALRRLRDIVGLHGARLRQELGADSGDERVIEEIFEENLDHLLRDDDDFQVLADELMEEIERRFDLLNIGQFNKTKQGWPKYWSWSIESRTDFLQVMARFSSNHARYFGTLLSPLVNGIRVSGFFKPAWAELQPKLVLIDGEGLGHTPDSSASIPTALTRRFDEVDVILLVDNATQPMQAAPVQLMRSLAASGKANKLMTIFTHMDVVKGDNLPSFSLKKQHVLASAENVLTAIGEQLGRFAERVLRVRLRSSAFFVGNIDEGLDAGKGSHRRTIDQFLSLITAIEASKEIVDFADSIPVYDRVNLVLAVKNAAERFQEDWLVKLGYRVKPGVSKEHWTRVKALTRRLAEGWSDEYDTLKPVADLYRSLQDDIYLFVQNPVRWEGAEPDDEEKQKLFDRFAHEISNRSLDLATRRLRTEHQPEWQNAYSRRGIGSTFQRAAILKDDIYDRAAPVPDVAPSVDRNQFLHQVIAVVNESSTAAEVKLQ